jgi:membrane-associated PAP2 superfamily phosphatase
MAADHLLDSARPVAAGERATFIGALLLTALLVLWIGAATDLDLMLADAAFDHASMTFPWRHAWLTEVFAHVALKRALIVLGSCFIVMATWDLLSARAWSALRRFQMRVVALSAILVPAAITLTKHLSVSHCPWDLVRYGGVEPYVRLLEAMPRGTLAGGCMPAGHAATALWMVSLAVFFLPARPRAAIAAALVLLAAGFGVGWMQQLRGAHFLTHTLWSMWIACAIVGTLYLLMKPSVPPSQAPPSDIR